MSDWFRAANSIPATKMNGISWINGTSPAVPVTFGLGVNPVCAMVIPVVKLATLVICVDAKTISTTRPKILPIAPIALDSYGLPL